MEEEKKPKKQQSVFKSKEAYKKQLEFLKQNRYTGISDLERKDNLQFAKREITIKRTHKNNQKQNKRRFKDAIVFYSVTKDYNYLKYCQVIFNFFALKYDMTVVEIQILLYFYSYHLPITKDVFMAYLKTIDVHRSSLFDKFVREGYIVKLKRKYITTGEVNDINLYKISMQSNIICLKLYERFDGIAKLEQTKRKTTEQEKELYKLLSELDDEIKELKNGTIQPEKTIHEDNLKRTNNK